MATYFAIANFNDGAVSGVNLLKKLGLQPGYYCVKGFIRFEQEADSECSSSWKYCTEEAAKDITCQA